MTRTEELRQRLLGHSPTDRVWGWVAPLLVAVVGGVLRFWHLERPHALVFDETYYVKQATSMLRAGVELKPREGLKEPDSLFARGTTDVFGAEGDFVVHPPVGKWVLALGQELFGSTSSFGWRFSAALLGTLSILVVARVGRRMFGSTLLGCTAGLLLALDGLHLVMSRAGLLDVVLMFFALCGFAALLVDRDRSREVLARTVGALPAGVRPSLGPWLGWRPWRWVAGVSLGLAGATKWSGIFFLAAFGLLTVWWDMGARRTAGVRRWALGAVLRDGPYAAAQLVLVALLVYVASWAGWFRSDAGFNRRWAEANPTLGVQWLPPALRSLWDYHVQMWTFNTTLQSPHAYSSKPWTWLLQLRPTSFFYEAPKRGSAGCQAADCSQAITSLGTVSLWWASMPALLVLLWWWLARRDWRAGAIWAGVAAGWFPWLYWHRRTIFTFYSVAFVPWLALAVTFCLGLLIGGPVATRRRRVAGVGLVAAYLLLTLGLFWFFHPVWTAEVVPYEQWRARMWLPRWI